MPVLILRMVFLMDNSKLADKIHVYVPKISPNLHKSLNQRDPSKIVNLYNGLEREILFLKVSLPVLI